MKPLSRKINVALFGVGNVGRAFAWYVLNSGEAARISIRAAADHTGGLLFNDATLGRLIAHKESGKTIRDLDCEGTKSHHEFIHSLSDAGISVVVESLPTNLTDGQPALGLICEALARGVDVVTADKGPLVWGLDALNEAARVGGSRIGFSGTTGVCPPDEIAGRRVIEIRGVLNGTTNYILSRIQERPISFDQALAEAQADGIAEPDPRLDIEGWDTAAKILILANTLMGARAGLSDVSRIGIGVETEPLIDVARARGGVVRLVGRARIWQGRVRVSVAPKVVTPDSPFYPVGGTSKAATFKIEGGGEFLSMARSGRDAISRVILDDIIRLAKSSLKG